MDVDLIACTRPKPPPHDSAQSDCVLTILNVLLTVYSDNVRVPQRAWWARVLMLSLGVSYVGLKSNFSNWSKCGLGGIGPSVSMKLNYSFHSVYLLSSLLRLSSKKSTFKRHVRDGNYENAYEDICDMIISQ